MGNDSEHPSRRTALGTIGLGAMTAATALPVFGARLPAAAAPADAASAVRQPVRGVEVPIAQRGCL